MGHSQHIGRIGALAFALGVGIGLGASPGVALADDTATATATNASASDTGTRTAGVKSRNSDRDASPSAGGGPDASEPQKAEDSENSQKENSGNHTGGASPRAGDEEPDGDEPEADDPPVDVADDVESSHPAETGSSIPIVSGNASPSVEPVPAPPAATTSVTVSPALSPLASPAGAPTAPADAPPWWTLLAAARRQLSSGAPTRITTASGQATAAALLTPEQAAAISRLGDITVGNGPTDVVATDTRAYVLNSGGKSITVIDTLTGTVVDTISLRYTPAKLAITPSGNRLYVTNAVAGTVSVISTAFNSVLKTIRVGDNPTGIAVSRSGSRVYVVNSDDGTVSKISTLTNNVVGTVYGVGKGVSSIAVSPDGSTIFTTSSTTGDVSYFSSSSLFAGTLAGVTSGSLGIAFGADGSRVFVSDAGGSVKVIDAAARAVVDSIPVAAGVPFDVTVSPDGTTLFVARSNDGKLSVYDIATKTELTSVVANPYLVDGPARIAVSPDGTQLYWTDFSGDRVHVISLIAPNVDPVAGTPIVNAPNASGQVTGSVTVIDPEGRPLTYTVSAPGKGTVTVTQNNGVLSFTYTPRATAQHAAAANGAPSDAKTDSFTITVTDGQRGVTTVPVTVTVAPANVAPTATVKVTSSWFSAKVFVTVTGKDSDRDSLTYTAGATAKGGKVTQGADGEFTYTPTAAAQHAAASAGATEADKRDTFDVVIDDGHGGLSTVSVTVAIQPGNTTPAATVRTSSSWFSAKVTGTVSAKDPEGDPLTFTASATDKGGTVVINSRGRFTYTPSDAARHAAAAADATDADKQDGFEITVSDGHGGVTTVAVAVVIKPANSAPTRASASEVFTNPNSGVTTGKITAVDADGDAVTYVTVSGTRKGELVMAPDGTFSYVPTAEARAEASKRFAPSWDRTDSFRVTVDDGHGGTKTLTVRVGIAPFGHANQNPAGGTFTAGQPNSSSGKVGGTASASDAERDVLTYGGSGATPKGSVIVDAAGGFVYTPTDAARLLAGAPGATAADKQDTFTVTVTDGYGGELAIPVTVVILAPTVV